MSSNSKNTYNFCIIGENSLSLRCCEVLIAAGHRIIVLVTQHLPSIEWAEGQRINVCSSPLEIVDYLLTDTIDYLMSIVNSTILPTKILALAKKGAINYHDSLLPKYTGLHATTWAIINNETEHGITWHFMTEQLDAGNILIQKSFPITPDETCLSLNLKCYENAITSFMELLNCIEHQTLRPINQDHKSRTAYHLKDKPPHYGTFNTTDYSAEELYRFHRSLYMGVYPNNICSFKLIINEAVVIPEKLIIKKIKSTLPPGTIVLKDKNELHLATHSYDIVLKGLKNAVGEAISPFDINVSAYNNANNSADLKILDSLSKISTLKDSHWLEIFRNIVKDDIPHANELTKEEFSYAEIDLPTMPDFTDSNLTKSFFITITAIYLYRLNNYKNFFLFVDNDLEILNAHKLYGCIYSKQVPFLADLESNLSIQDAFNSVHKKLINNVFHQTFALDIFDRYEDIDFQNNTPGISISFINNNAIQNELYRKFNIFIDLEKNLLQYPIIHNMENPIAVLINNLGRHIVNIINIFKANPNETINKLCFLTDVELSDINSWGLGKRISHFDFNRIDLYFDKMATLHPNNIAIYEKDITFSYRDIYRKTEFLKYIFNPLMKSCISKRQPIMVFLERSANYIITVLSILKSSCSFIPVDVTYPDNRIKYIIEDSKPYLIATTLNYKDKINELLKILERKRPPKIVLVDVNSVVTKSDEHGEKNFSQNNIAYTIYTSGTTGAPKGVLVTHFNVINYYYWFREMASLTPQSIFDFSSSVSFDLSIPCYLLPLMHGAAVSICSDETKLNPIGYLDYLDTKKITHTEITPGYFSQLIIHKKNIKGLVSLKHILLGAEALIKEDIKKWFEYTDRIELINEYGPTECTVACLSFKINPLTLTKHLNSIPLGKPCINTEVYVLDKYLNLCPTGGNGELFISGYPVTLGYLNKPTITKKLFIENSKNKDYSVMYKTGDNVRWLSDGNIEYLSRIDSQIKINGYRIEIAEVTANILKYNEVQQCFVAAHKNENGHGYLTAYIVTNDRRNFDISKLKKFLLDNYPIYTVPNKFVIVTYIPLNSSGKVDQAKLFSQYGEHFSSATEYIPPQKLTEKLLTDIWQNVLNPPVIGINDDFFELGGHSLAAIDVITKINNRLYTNIVTYDLFKYPTIKQLSEYIDSHVFINKSGHRIISLSKEINKDAHNIYLVHPLGGTVFWYKALATQLGNTYNVYGIEDPGLYNLEKYQFKTLDEMIEYYCEIIINHTKSKSFILGGASFGANVSLKMAEKFINDNIHVKAVLLFDGWANYPENTEFENDVLTHLKSSYTDEQLQDLYNIDWDKFINLQKARKNLLSNYAVSINNKSTKVALFKANEINDMFSKHNSDDNGWNSLLENLQVYLVPGNHMSMFQDDHTTHFTEKLIYFLNEA